jgi:tRNA pseudouridine38-40 synthase
MSEECVARIQLAYDGSDFHGWQVQPGLRTVQGELMRALSRLVPIEGPPPGAGRTDAGVHARGQVTSVAVESPDLVERIARALPRMMPSDIGIVAVTKESPEFHARYSATGRRYVYRVAHRFDPMRRLDHLLVRDALDVAAMRQATSDLLGDHDCTSFCRPSSVEPGRTRCVIRKADLREADETLVFEIAADRFLHSMVRVIVGTLLEIGRGRREATAFPEIIAACKREAAGSTAPAHGLCLEEVEYGQVDRRESDRRAP